MASTDPRAPLYAYRSPAKTLHAGIVSQNVFNNWLNLTTLQVTVQNLPGQSQRNPPIG